MWGNSRKQKTGKIDTLIGQQTEVTGDVKFGGGLHVDGTIKGRVSAESDDHSLLSLSEMGTIEGEIRVPYSILNGLVNGSVHSSEHIELAPNSRITGDVYYNQIEMSSGAQVNGKLIHSPNAGEKTPEPVIDMIDDNFT